MDIWLTDEVWWRHARIEGNEPFNCARFAIYCLFGSIVGGELLYILIKTARGGQRIAPFNLMIPVLGFLLVQFIVLVSAMWLAYTPWRPVYPSVVDFALGLGMFCSIWTPLALAEVTILLHSIIFKDTGSTANHNAVKIKRATDWVFVGLSVVTNLVRNALWVARMESSVDWDHVLSFQHFYFGVEGMTLINIVVTAGLLNTTEYQHQEVTVRAIKFLLVPLLCVREVFVYVHYSIADWGYDIQWYKYRVGQASVQGLFEVLIAIALMHCYIIYQQQESLVHVPSSFANEVSTSPRHNP